MSDPTQGIHVDRTGPLPPPTGGPVEPPPGTPAHPLHTGTPAPETAEDTTALPRAEGEEPAAGPSEEPGSAYPGAGEPGADAPGADAPGREDTAYPEAEAPGADAAAEESTSHPDAGQTPDQPHAAPAGAGPTRPPRGRRQRQERRSSVPVVLASLVAGLIGGLGGGVLAQELDTGREEPVQSRPGGQLPDPVPVSVGGDGSIADLSRAVLPSVALVSVGPDGRDGQGSGFVIRDDGYLLTNHHVVARAVTDGGEITVSLPGEDPIAAEVVGSDSVYDIAVLRVERAGLPALAFADSGVEVGQTVVAIGAPLGLDSTVTSGIVSAMDRPVVAGETQDLSYINAIQTDAAINPGNSGGPLLDLAGNVVGVNSAIAQTPNTARAAAGSIGLGFAIPAEQAERTATQLIETGTSQYPVMGVHIDLTYTGDGARVLTEGDAESPPVIPGGPAEDAGVRPGDVIVSVDGTRITDSRHLLVVLRSYAIGETVEMVLRDENGRERTVNITLAGSGE